MLNSLRKVSPASPRVSRAELAALADCTERMIEYRVGRKQLSPPGPDGRFDRARALAELAAKPKQKGGRKRGMKITSKAAEVAARESAPILRDPATRFRLARAGQEEIKLAKLHGRVERVATIAPR